MLTVKMSIVYPAVAVLHLADDLVPAQRLIVEPITLFRVCDVSVDGGGAPDEDGLALCKIGPFPRF